MNIELVADSRCVLGEGPLWHPDEKCLLWLDILSGKMLRYDPASSAHETIYEGALVAGITLQEDGALLLFGNHGSIRRWKDGQFTTLIESIPGEEDFRFNDVIADPDGRVFCGTLHHSQAKPGRLYQLDTNGSLTQVLDGIGVSNGMGFSPDRRTMYYTDSPAQEVYRFDYDAESGAISNQQVFARITENEVFPDGLTVDSEGGVWSALWGGHCILRYLPDGTIDRRIELPAAHVTSAIFGGDDLGDLYITTATGTLDTTPSGEKKPAEPGIGSLYRVRPGIQGMPEFRSKIAAQRPS